MLAYLLVLVVLGKFVIKNSEGLRFTILGVGTVELIFREVIMDIVLKLSKDPSLIRINMIHYILYFLMFIFAILMPYVKTSKSSPKSATLKTFAVSGIISIVVIGIGVPFTFNMITL
jgi:hypothetical protein